MVKKRLFSLLVCRCYREADLVKCNIAICGHTYSLLYSVQYVCNESRKSLLPARSRGRNGGTHYCWDAIAVCVVSVKIISLSSLEALSSLNKDGIISLVKH